MEKTAELENSIEVNLDVKEYIKIKSSYGKEVRVELNKLTDSGKEIKILGEVLDKNNNVASVKGYKTSNRWGDDYVLNLNIQV